MSCVFQGYSLKGSASVRIAPSLNDENSDVEAGGAQQKEVKVLLKDARTGKSFVIAKLKGGAHDQENLDLYMNLAFSDYEIQLQGPNDAEVHVTGYMEAADHDLDLSGSDDDDEEEETSALRAKQAGSKVPALTAGKKKASSADDDSADDDEDDEDSESDLSSDEEDETSKAKEALKQIAQSSRKTGSKSATPSATEDSDSDSDLGSDDDDEEINSDEASTTGESADEDGSDGSDSSDSEIEERKPSKKSAKQQETAPTKGSQKRNASEAKIDSGSSSPTKKGTGASQNPNNQWEKDLISFLKTNGPTQLSAIGSKVKKPAAVNKKLGEFVRERASIFQIKNNELSLKSGN